jgi:hypothetical protein
VRRSDAHPRGLVQVLILVVNIDRRINWRCDKLTPLGVRHAVRHAPIQSGEPCVSSAKSLKKNRSINSAEFYSTSSIPLPKNG